MIQLLIVAIFLVSFICLWVLIDQRKNPKLLVVGIPITFGLIIYSYESYKSLLGRPKPLSILLSEKKSHIYLSHYINEPDKIYLWILKKGNVPYSYEVDFTDDLKKALREANQRSKDGETVLIEPTDLKSVGLETSEEGDIGDPRGGQEPQKGFTKGGGLEFYTWDYANDPRFRKD